MNTMEEYNKAIEGRKIEIARLNKHLDESYALLATIVDKEYSKENNIMIEAQSIYIANIKWQLNNISKRV